jgi:hypothetical protein
VFQMKNQIGGNSSSATNVNLHTSINAIKCMGCTIRVFNHALPQNSTSLICIFSRKHILFAAQSLRIYEFDFFFVYIIDVIVFSKNKQQCEYSIH